MTSLLCPAGVAIDALRLEETALAGVYFIQQGDTGPIKIGWSKNVRSRLASLQTANPQRLRLLLVLKGEERDERRLHDWFSLERLGGEWFRGDGEVAAFVTSKKAAGKLAKGEHRCGMSDAVVVTQGRDGGPCWGTIEYYSDGEWLCEGHFHLAQYGSYLHKVHSRPGETECYLHGTSNPCWGELRSYAPFERKPHYKQIYCEAHHPVDGVYTLIASKAASEMAEVRAYADETAEHMERIYKRLADIAGCEWAYIPELAPSTEQIVKRIEGDAEAIASLRIYVFGEAGECNARDRVDTLLASLGGDLEG